MCIFTKKHFSLHISNTKIWKKLRYLNRKVTFAKNIRNGRSEKKLWRKRQEPSAPAFIIIIIHLALRSYARY